MTEPMTVDDCVVKCHVCMKTSGVGLIGDSALEVELEGKCTITESGRCPNKKEHWMWLRFGDVPQHNAIEQVNHPSHYGGDTPYEVIKVLHAWLTPEELRGFLKGNVIKYLARADKKAGPLDYAKATWYQNYLDKFLKE